MLTNEVIVTKNTTNHAVGVVMGKRYIDEAETLEVLCVKAGDGSLAANGTLLLQKDTKKLPKTD